MHDLKPIRTVMHAIGQDQEKLRILRLKLNATVKPANASYVWQPLHRDEIEYALKYLCEYPKPQYSVERLDTPGAAAAAGLTVLALRALFQRPTTLFQWLAAGAGAAALITLGLVIGEMLIDTVKNARSTRRMRAEWDAAYAVHKELEKRLYAMTLNDKEWSHEVP